MQPFAPRLPAIPPTQVELDYAELPIVDLSNAVNVNAELVRTAMRTHGFFYVVGHGYTPEQTTRMFDIADLPFIWRI
ncbi:Clavaminate synthase-like protein [Mycena kentingensis (nom. inval.)]|nr:Clavaminate synthase-like protein [Mycena kentingensis (nom. inval.)]